MDYFFYLSPVESKRDTGLDSSQTFLSQNPFTLLKAIDVHNNLWMENKTELLRTPWAFVMWHLSTDMCETDR